MLGVCTVTKVEVQSTCMFLTYSKQLTVTITQTIWQKLRACEIDGLQTEACLMIDVSTGSVYRLMTDNMPGHDHGAIQ